MKRAKRVMTIILMVLLLTAAVQADTFKFEVTNISGSPLTDLNSVAIYRPGTATSATVYTGPFWGDGNNSGVSAVTNPIVSGLASGSFEFWGDYPTYDLVIKRNNHAGIIKCLSLKPTMNRIIFPDTDNKAISGESNSISYIVKTKKYVIASVGDANFDANFTSAANTTEQVIDCGTIVPAFARVLDVQLITNTAAVFSGGATTLVAEIGSASSGNQYAASATIYAIDVILSCATGTAPIAAASATAGHVYVAATPGANWSTMTAGKWTLLVTYIDGGVIK